MRATRADRNPVGRPVRVRLLASGLAGLAALAGVGVASAVAQEPYDVLVRGGRVVDGTGNPWYRADVAIRGDRIAAVGDLSDAEAREVVDASGLVVTPGFIDVHSHAADGLATPGLSHGRPLLAQGITTVVVNPDGGGPLDLAVQATALERDGLGVNVARLVPLSSIRREVMGMQDRVPTPAELSRMQELVRRGMKAGAFGLSSGLFSAPGTYATTEEIVSLARAAAPFGGVYASHVRDESDYTVGVVASVDEVITVARESGLRGIVTHIKALGPRVWGFSEPLIQRIQRAREQGVEVFADQYPYTASATGLIDALIPRWAEEGGRDALLARLTDPELLPRIREETAVNLDRRGGPDRIQFRRFEQDPAIEGRTLADVAAQRGLDAVEATLALARQGAPAIVSFNMLERDVLALMSRPWVMTCTDGDLVPLGEGVPHPRSYGAFSHKIRRYVVETGALTLEAVVRSMTLLPSTVFGIDGRGVLRAGARADILVFDPARLRDVGTYSDPHHLSEGMVHVWVNGRRAVLGGQFTQERGGLVLRPAAPSAGADASEAASADDGGAAP